MKPGIIERCPECAGSGYPRGYIPPSLDTCAAYAFPPGEKPSEMAVENLRRQQPWMVPVSERRAHLLKISRFLHSADSFFDLPAEDCEP